jgi:hypothetical protein
VLLSAVALGQHATAYASTTTCPALGDDTDCGIIITIDGTGAHLAVTGQGPYDGNDDTLVGVVNNSARPIGSLILSSSADIFAFDGDGIDTYGAPGNPQDTTGYGGPNTYFTAINASATSGTVNFVTPLPAGGGTTYFGLEDSVANAVSCQDAVNSSVKDTVGGPNIDATFTPNQGLTLQQAAQLCGFQNFDWVQTITKLDDPSPFIARNINGAFNSKVNGPVRITSGDTPFSDPPQGGGYSYEGSPDNSYPFYYDVTTELSRHQVGGVTMTFYDRPSNPCLSGGAAVGTAKCADGGVPPGGYESFVTHLAGVNADGSATDLGIGFTWTSNYNGTTGQVRAKSIAAKVGTGTGGVTVTSVQPDTTYQYDGISVTGVNGGAPGPASTMLVYSGVQALPEGTSFTLSARLSTIDTAPVQGRQVTLTLGEGQSAASCTAVSDSTGLASCAVRVAQQLGPTAVTASFTGDSSFLSSSTTYNVIVFAYTIGGTFVIGNESDGHLLPSKHVTFWSPRWAQKNKLSGGPAPSSFFGFEFSVAPPECSSLRTWIALGLVKHNTDHSQQYVPAYTAVIVSSDINAIHRIIIRGDMVDVAIISTTPGSRPFGTGTGVIAATLC